MNYFLYNDDHTIVLKIGGCDCCASYRKFPEEEWYAPITAEDVKEFEAHLRDQQEMLSKLQGMLK